MSSHTIARTREQALTLIQELERRSKSAVDFVVKTSDFQTGIFAEGDSIVPGISLPALDGGNPDFRTPPHSLKPTAVSQLAGICNIPGDYARRIHDGFPGLFANSVETLKPEAKRYMFRALDGQYRAILSDKFRVLDNYDFAFEVLKVAQNVNAEISRVTLTDDRFEMRLTVPDWRERIGWDDGFKGYQHVKAGAAEIIPGIYASNGETGRSGLNVKFFLWDGICSNGLLTETALRQIHLGGQQDIGHLSRESIEADSKAVWLKVRDLVTAAFDRDRFKAVVEQYRTTGEFDLGQPVEAVDLLVKNEGLNQDDRQAILNELIAPSHGRNAGPTVLGLLNAVTQRAQAYEETEPDKATSLEELAGRMLAKPQEYVVVRR